MLDSALAIHATGVKKVYHSRGRPPVEALKDLNLTVGKGQRVSLLGRNGAGKTTFLKIASTLLLPTSGKIEIFGTDAVESPEKVRQHIALVPQEGHPFYHLTPSEQVYTYLLTRGFSRESARARTEASLEQMGLAEIKDQLNVTLSGGQQQRTMVATVLSTGAPLLFLDEPTLGMDPFARREVWKALRDLTNKGSTILLTTHYLDEAENLSNKVYIVDKGLVVAEGTSDDLKRRTGGTIRVSLLSANLPSEEFLSFGKIIRGDGVTHIITEPSRVSEILSLAMRRGADVTVGPVTLEEAFLQLVGRSIEHEEQ